MAHFFSRSLYRCLLRLHPPSFQREFSDEMLWTFDEIAAEGSPVGRAAFRTDQAKP